MNSSEEIRKKFIEYFSKRDHAYIASSSLVPTDPSVLFTTAGMQQFKPYFTGELTAETDFGKKSTASIQKCIRTNDIDEVGDNTHATFFEMLGNFSFGGYFKKEAITYAFEFITKELGLEISYVTIFEGSNGVPKDEESRKIWNNLGVTDVREETIDDVFWGPTGTEGPCGPTTEIYCKTSAGQDVEVWNIVFNQFYYPGSREELLAGTEGKELAPLKIQGIDTGMGFERLVAIAQGGKSFYDTDLFAEFLKKFTEILAEVKTEIPIEVQERMMRVFADHFRASVFLIGDGVIPSNKDQGYILRRLIRRMLAYKVIYVLPENIFEILFPLIAKKFGAYYPEVKNPEITSILFEEQKKFERAVRKGLTELSKLETLNAEKAFALSSTYGIGFELIKEMAPVAAKDLKKEDFEKEFKRHQELSKAGAEKKFGGHGLLLDTGELKAKDEVELKKVTRLHTATHLLQAALRNVLGPEVSQAGSDITAERTRFDFNFPRKLTPEEITAVENLVNSVIEKDVPVQYKEMKKEEAEKTGALYFFKERYPENVKVYYAGNSLEDAFSKEFCGGPHVEHTGTIGKFKIKKEESVGTGIRRIRAVVLE